MRVSVIGGGGVGDDGLERAEAVGRLLAERGHAVVCGGLGGVMEATCRGARAAGGETIGVLPTSDVADANEHVTVPIATGLSHARNALVPMNGDAVIAVSGSSGTLSEIGFAGVYGKPVAGLGTHEVAWVEPVASPREAVDYVENEVDG